MESIFTTPTLLLLVVFVVVPEYTSENVPVVVGLFGEPPSQFKFADHGAVVPL